MCVFIGKQCSALVSRAWAVIACNMIPEITNTKDLAKLKGITYGALNVRSLFKYVDEIHLLERTDLDILMLSETFLNFSVSNAVIDTNHYNTFRLDRDGGLGRRGVEAS